MQQKSRIFFQELENDLTITNLLSIIGDSKNITSFLESQLFNNEKHINNLNHIDLNSMSLRNYITHNEQPLNPLMILCDEAQISLLENKEYNITLNFYTHNGIRHQLIEELSFLYPHISFNNIFFNIEVDYCGQLICNKNNSHLSSFDSFQERFGGIIHIYPEVAVISPKKLTVEMPAMIHLYENPFNFQAQVLNGMYKFHFSMASIDLLELIVNSFHQPKLHSDFLNRMENSPLKMMQYLHMSGLSFHETQTSPLPFSFKKDKFIGLAYFYNILSLYINNRNMFQSFYTSLLLEKQSKLF